MRDNSSANVAFSAQASHYDIDDKANPVIADLRKQVYEHVARYMKPGSRILELNAGTGIDASYFVSIGHMVVATDLSDGMVTELNKKAGPHAGRLRVRQLSYDRLNEIPGTGPGQDDGPFDYIFSNFGGLNCIDDLTLVTRHLPRLLKPDGYVTFVIMPVICGWELLSTFKGSPVGFRRLKKEALARIDNEYFPTWYHSFKEIRKAFGESFTLTGSEGLAAVSPPPYRADFPLKHPRLYKFLRSTDKLLNRSFPFNRWADHIITTFRLKV
jgi:SAM-dependent methyltransferase